MRIRSMAPPMAGRIRAPLLAAGLVLGCGHTEPFSNPPYGSDAPFDPSPPQRLTYNTAADRSAAWLPDGSGILYSTQLVDRPDGDLCLALLPPTGGSQRDLWCDVPEGADQRDAIQSASASPAGALAFVAATGTIAGGNPGREAFAVASHLDPRDAQTVRMFPITPEGGSPQNTAEFLRWMDDTRLAYVGQQLFTRVPCQGCVMDTLRAGRDVSILETALPGSTPTALAGTANATGVAAAPGTDYLYFTLGGSSQVFRRELSTGATVVVHDFGPAGIARDVHVAGNRLAATVGGRVAFVVDPSFGPVQWDSGGVIQVLDLQTGVNTELEPGPRLYRRPVLSPDGSALVAEGYPLIITPISFAPPVADTTVGRSGDLFLFGAP